MKKITLLTMALFAGQLFTNAQTSCNDLNGYVQSKNAGGTGAYTLTVGLEENAAQTFHYSGPGNITGVRIHGYAPNFILGVNLAAKVYNVDVSGRPTTAIGSKNFQWTWWDNLRGYKDIAFSGAGIPVYSNFAMAVEIVGGFPFDTKFQIGYTGDTEGKGENLASLSGTSTGFNWSSAKNNFSKDGDFYIIPKMKHFIQSQFSVSANCLNTGGTVSFTNLTEMTRDSMFNTIGLSAYSGSEYFYSWDFGDGSPVSHVANPSHTYSSGNGHTISLTATLDGWNGTCSDTYTMQISVGLNASTPSVTNVTCNGSSNGTIVASATGGITPYSYSLDGITYQSSATFSGLAAGSYLLYVRDAFGCVKTTPIVVTQPGPIAFSSTSTTNASCGNADGALLTTASGGVGTLQYSLNGSTWQASGSFNNLSAGGYTIWAKDVNGCSKVTNAMVNDAGSPLLNINSYTHISCKNGNNGTIVASASGGSGTLQYSVDGINYQVNGSFNNLTAGVYNVYVKDANSCINVKSVTLLEPPQIALTAAPRMVSCHAGNDGEITVTSTTGGTGTPSFSINGINYQSSGTFNGLTAGTYTVYVKDVAGCTSTTNVTITHPSAISPVLAVTNASCNNAADGSLFITTTGGTPEYSYSLDGINYYPTGDFSDLLAGTYTVSIKDSKGCISSVVSTITQPVPITAVVTTGNSTCGNANGNILVVASGGSGSGYQYSLNGTTWSASGSFTSLTDSSYIVLVKDGSNCGSLFHAFITDANGPVIQSLNHTNISCNNGHDGTITVTSVTGGSGTLYYSVDGSTWQTSSVFTNLPAGDHTIMVADALGCSGISSVVLTSPSAIVVNTAIVDVICNEGNNGSVTITAGGGAGTLAYSLDGISFQSSNIFSNLVAGNYTAYVRDAGGCMNNSTFAITQPPAIVIYNIGVLNVTCHGSNNGSIYVVAAGGTSPLSYSLDGITYQSNNLFTGLAGGSYNVYMKDANGCVKMIITSIKEPMVLAVASNIHNVKCSGGNDGVVDISVVGGTAPYYYAWSNGAITEDIFNLQSGVYTVQVTDANGCKSVIGFSVSQPSNPLVVNSVITSSSNNTSADGAINITTTGGTGPYTYSWTTGAITEDVSGLNPGVYVVTITDVNGCVTSGIFTVTAVTGIESIDINSDIHVYPNPAQEYVIVKVDGLKIDRIEVVNVLGEVIYKAEPKTETIQLHVGNYSEGLYFVKLTMQGYFITKKIQVSR